MSMLAVEYPGCPRRPACGAGVPGCECHDGDRAFPCAGAAAAQEGAREAVFEGLSRVIASMPKEASEAAAAAALDLTRPPLQRLQQLLAGALHSLHDPANKAIFCEQDHQQHGQVHAWFQASGFYAVQGNSRLRQATLQRLRGRCACWRPRCASRNNRQRVSTVCMSA